MRVPLPRRKPLSLRVFDTRRRVTAPATRVTLVSAGCCTSGEQRLPIVRSSPPTPVRRSQAFYAWPVRSKTPVAGGVGANRATGHGTSSLVAEDSPRVRAPTTRQVSSDEAMVLRPARALLTGGRGPGGAGSVTGAGGLTATRRQTCVGPRSPPGSRAVARFPDAVHRPEPSSLTMRATLKSVCCCTGRGSGACWPTPTYARHAELATEARAGSPVRASRHTAKCKFGASPGVY